MMLRMTVPNTRVVADMPALAVCSVKKPAWLQFECFPVCAAETKLKTIAIFEPLGLIGELYWTTTYPAHSIIFNGMHHEIGSRAENLRH